MQKTGKTAVDIYAHIEFKSITHKVRYIVLKVLSWHYYGANGVLYVNYIIIIGSIRIFRSKYMYVVW